MRKAEAVSAKTANEELGAWLDFKKISSSKRETLKDVADEIIEAIQEGNLSIEPDTKVITYKFKFVPETKSSIEVPDKIVIQPRVSVGIINAQLKSVNPSDVNGRIIAYACAVSNLTPSDFRILDTTDFGTISAVVSYFF